MSLGATTICMLLDYFVEYTILIFCCPLHQIIIRYAFVAVLVPFTKQYIYYHDYIPAEWTGRDITVSYPLLGCFMKQTIIITFFGFCQNLSLVTCLW